MKYHPERSNGKADALSRQYLGEIEAGREVPQDVMSGIVCRPQPIITLRCEERVKLSSPCKKGVKSVGKAGTARHRFLSCQTQLRDQDRNFSAGSTLDSPERSLQLKVKAFQPKVYSYLGSIQASQPQLFSDGTSQ